MYSSPHHQNHDVCDEDSGEEDGIVNNLNGNQPNATSTATVIIRTEKKIIGGVDCEQSGSEDEDDNSEDSDGNLSNKDSSTYNDSSEECVSHKRRRIVPDASRNWTKKDLPIGTADKFPWLDVPTVLSQQNLELMIALLTSILGGEFTHQCNHVFVIEQLKQCNWGEILL